MELSQVKQTHWNWIVAVTGLLAVGCGGGDPSATTTAQTPGAPGAVNMNFVNQKIGEIPRAPAGMPLPPNTPVLDSSKEYLRVAQNVYPGSRRDPFRLFSKEATFEVGQQRERLAGDLGGWSTLIYEEPAPKPDISEMPVEPQPRRRLAGVLLGDGASALLEMEDGNIYDVRPGSRVGEWTVLSIDGDKCVLYRDPSKRPSEVTVYLDGSLNGGGGGQPGGAGGGQPGGRRPGAAGDGGGSGGSSEGAF